MIDYIFGGIVDVHNSSPSFKLKQYDNNSHKLHMTIVDKDNPYGNTVNLEGHSVRAYFKLPDGSDEYVDCELIKPKSGKIAVPFPSSVTQQVGIVKCEIRISEGNNLISLNVFTFEIVESIYNSSAIESTEKYSALDRALIEVQSVRSEMNMLVASPAGSGGDVGTELRDIRAGYDGAEYETAGEAVRRQVSGLKLTINNLLAPIAYTENPGYYFGENGSLIADSSATACVYTDKITVYGGQTVQWNLGTYTYKHILWGAYMEYDSENNVIGSRNVFCNTSSSETKATSGEFTVSENASKIALCWRSYGQSNMLTGVIFYDNNFISDMNENRQHISNVENMLIYSNGIGAATELKKSHYVRYSDGVAIGSGGYFRYYTYVNPVFNHIKAFLYATDTVPAAIAFYSGTEINSETYMQEYSVQFKSNSTSGKWHEADVPNGCSLVVITTRTDYTNATPLVEFSGNDTIKILDSAIIENKDHIAEVDEKINAANGGVLSGIGKYFYHFGMAAVAYHDVPVNIPSQSIFDVRNAANLGYKCIECNIQKTLDNKYVVTHGLNGYLGHDFNDLNGNNVGGQIKISDVTFDDLRALYVYRCTNPDYRTPITSLEEFLYECKRQGISVMAGYKDEDSLYIARGIMGANLIMYNAPRRLYDGVILEWRSDATKDAILARCETVGKPYIYSMAEPSHRFTDEELVDIVKALHNAGYYVASAYVGNGMRFLGLGFDFIAVDTDPNPDTVINGKKLIFNQDGTVTWVASPLSS